jgi:drug/metabolite transporter (DMT)-like permease
VTAVVGGAASERHPVALPAGILAVLAWSLGPLCVRGIDASIPTVVFFRLWLAQPLMIGVAMLSGGGISRSSLRVSFVPGVLFALGLVSSFASYQNTSIVNATLIGSLTPAVMMVVAPRIFGDSRSSRQWLLAGVAFAGLALVVLGAGKTSGAGWDGNVYALMNLAIFTVYFIRLKHSRNAGVHASSLIASVFLVAAVVATPWALVASDDLGALHGQDWLLLLVMVFVPGLIGHGSMTWAQRYLDITVASMLMLGQPVFSTIGAWLVYDERLNLIQVVGSAVVLAGLAGVVLHMRSSAGGPETALSLATE